MSETAITAWIKKHRIACISVLVFVIYLGSGMAFRAYRMNPENEYPSVYLPSAAQTTITADSEEEAVEHLTDLFREPTLLERIFIPAEWFFRLTGI